MSRRPIVTNYVHPPIPDRSMDWSAYREGYDGGDDETGADPCGWGPTEADAIECLHWCELATAERLGRRIAALRRTAETGADWARVCLMEEQRLEMVALAAEWPAIATDLEEADAEAREAQAAFEADRRRGIS